MSFRIIAIHLMLCGYVSAGQSNSPIVGVQADGHTANLLYAEVTPDGKTVITTAGDGFVRFWDIRDFDSPRLLDVIRIQTGKPNDGGTLFACDISPDGRWLAVAGMMDRFYVIDIQRRTIVAMGQDSFNRIGDVEFSPDGRYLAMCDLNFVDVWPVSKLVAGNGDSTRTQLNKVGPRDRHGYRYSSHSVSWKRNGNDLQLLVSGWRAARFFRVPQSFGSLIPAGDFIRKGNDRIASKNTAATVCLPDGQRILTLSKPGDSREYPFLGMWTASGNFVADLNPKGYPLLQPLCVNEDGTAVACQAMVSINNKRRIRLFEFSLTEPGKFTMLPDTCLPHDYGPGNRLLLGEGASNGFAAPELKIMDRVRSRTSSIKPRTRDINRVQFSADGKRIGWTWPDAKTPVDGMFDFDSFRPKGVYPRGDLPWPWHAKRLSVAGYQVTEYRLSTGIPARNITQGTRTVIRPPDLEWCAAGEILPSGTRAVLGGIKLKMYDLKTRQAIREFVGFPKGAGSVLDLAVSPDGRTMITCHRDQILRVWDLQANSPIVKPMLSLLVTDDGQDFIAWTPEGYYSATPACQNFLSWSTPRGPNQFYDTVRSQQYHQSLNRPAVVELILTARTTANAIRQAASYENTKAAPMVSVGSDRSKLAVPTVNLTSPQASAIVQDDTVTLKGAVTSTGALPISEIRITVNSRPVAVHACLDIVQKYQSNSRSSSIPFSLEIPLLPNGPNTIEVSAATQSASSRPARLEVISRVQTAMKPNLHLLGIGVADYEQQDMTLAYPDDDVSGVIAALNFQQDRFYEKVLVDELLNDRVTERNIRRSLKQLSQNVTQYDVAIVMISGHGYADDRGEFYFCPHDFDPDEPDITGVPWEELTEPLTKLPCKVLLCIDTCYSAGVLEHKANDLRSKSTARRRRSAFENAMSDLRSVDPALVILTSSTNQQESFERDAWGHGAFALSLIEVLNGKHKVEGSSIRLPADINNDRFLEISEIDSYVTARVKELTNGRQQPVTDRGRAPSFPIGVAR